MYVPLESDVVYISLNERDVIHLYFLFIHYKPTLFAKTERYLRLARVLCCRRYCIDDVGRRVAMI